MSRKTKEWEVANMTASFNYQSATKETEQEKNSTEPLVDKLSCENIEKASLLSDEAKEVISAIFNSPEEFFSLTPIIKHFTQLWGSRIVVDFVIREIKIWLRNKK